MNPNQYLATAIHYLCTSRDAWPSSSAIGKTVVSSGMIDRVTNKLGRRLVEVPVGFKWFSQGFGDGSLGFGGEESAGASFLRRDGTVWTTDKDGIIMSLLAAEMTARHNQDPAQIYDEVTRGLGVSYYERVDAPASAELKTALKNSSQKTLVRTDVGGEPIQSKFDRAPGNNEPIGGIKVTTENGWFAARPSGTEDVYKIYAESFLSKAHLDHILLDAQSIVAALVS
jgi:phosphoglucomutase